MYVFSCCGYVATCEVCCVLVLYLPQNDESRVILHFHYTKWPDFGVPKTPDVFLDFLYAVRSSGVLNEDVGPCVVHCRFVMYCGFLFWVKTYCVVIHVCLSTYSIYILLLFFFFLHYLTYSAGIGRTGTFCLVDVCLKKVYKCSKLH